MSRIFLGPWVHWLILVILIGLAWFTGLDRVHVSKFNLFLTALILITVAAILWVIKSSPADQQVTRDPLEDDRDDERP